MTDDHPGYGVVSIALHWLVMALIIASWALGLYIVCIHVAAALKHHVFDRDEVLVRMLPFLTKAQELC